jgi:molybdenum cofactor biosynthesis enzyme MoaA
LKISKELGYSQIKLITNSVRFKDYEYASKMLPFLDDIAISFHSSNPKVQDELTNMK